jgi:hydrogenase maturation protein HypF
VQGVGFRPWVYRQARELGLDGWVLNDAGGVVVEIEGGGNELRHFRELLTGGAPPRSVIHEVVGQPLAATGVSGFEIRQSREDGAKTAVVLPDAATCGECLEDTLDPSDRRFRYPFTNCTNCGPRFSIIRSLPYDRPNTTMARFRMCPACHGEYDDPENRRFHAQPNACPDCGPRLRLLYRDGIRADRHEALSAAVERLHKGGIVAVKGLGGFHLMVDGGDSRAVSRLRERKARYEKPLALMVADLEQARACCRISTAAAAALTAPEAPIVLLPRLANAAIAPEVAPNNPLLGLMLPPSPLHHLLLSDFGGPLVATSGNRSEEPICIDNDEAQERLAGIADLFLVHDRPIARYIDDSVLVVIRDEVQPLRRARGLAPLPVRLGSPVPTVLAVGGQLKNTIGLGLGRDVYLSQHIGDLETQLARDAFERTIGDFLALYEARPVAVAHDLHPD